MAKKLNPEIVNMNGRIAIFMGAKFWPKTPWWKLLTKYTNAYEFTEPHRIAFAPEQLRYHESWEWVIPVCQKIERHGYIVQITFGVGTIVKIWNHKGTVASSENNFALGAVYEAVAQFMNKRNLIAV